MRYTREDGCCAWLTYGYIPCDTLQKILDDFGCAEAVYDAFLRTNGKCLKDYVNAASITALKEKAQPDAMHRMMLAMRNEGMGIMTLRDSIYPDMLRHIADPPVILFYQGRPDCLLGKCIAMVGTRKPSPKVEIDAREIARDLSNAGVTVVSGLAYGIDRAAHEGCLQGASPTAALMACGLDVDYPTGSTALRREIIAKGGVILSEYPPGFRVIPHLIPHRNRIISGLCKAVVMMEAQISSGSMTTVNHAVDQGRDVFAYPGNIGTEYAQAAHQLLRDGARYFTCAQDILEDLDWEAQASTAPEAAAATASLPPLNETQRTVYQHLSTGEKSYDELAQLTGFDAPTLSGALTMLQMMGLVRPMPGKIYSRI